MLNEPIRSWIIGLSATAGSLFILSWISYRVFIFFRITNKVVAQQRPEIINNGSVLINRSGQRLTLIQPVKPHAKVFYVLINDYFSLAQISFADLLTKYQHDSEIGLLTLSFFPDQLSDLIANWVDFLQAINNQYPKIPIRLVLEGYSCGLVKLIHRQFLAIDQFIYLNPITNHKVLRFGIWVRFLILFAFLFQQKIKKQFTVNYYELIADPQLAKKLTIQNKPRPVSTVYRLCQINKFLFLHLKKTKINQILVQASFDPFCNLKKLRKTFLTRENKIKVYTFKKSKHFNLNLTTTINKNIIN